MTRPFEIPEKQWTLLLANGHAVAADHDFEASPVVTLCLPDGQPLLLLAELNPDGQDIAFGLVDFVFSKPMLRFVSLDELSRDKVGQTLRAKPYRTSLGLTEITILCHAARRIVEPPGELSPTERPHCE